MTVETTKHMVHMNRVGIMESCVFILTMIPQLSFPKLLFQQGSPSMYSSCVSQ
jgi:hypothetical protein